MLSLPRVAEFVLMLAVTCALTGVLTDLGLAMAIRSIAARAIQRIHLVELPAGPLDVAAETTAYYVFLEAATNAQKHAPDAMVAVRVRATPHALTIEVSDDGPGGADEEPGGGLEGLRERVDAAGRQVSPPERQGIWDDRDCRASVVTRILVVDDSISFLAAATEVIVAADGFELAGVAQAGEEAVELARISRHDLALIDLNMPGLDGYETVARMAAESPETVTVLMTATPEPGRRSEGLLDKRRLSASALAGIWADASRSVGMTRSN